MPLFFSGKAITIDAEDYYDAKWTALDGFYQYVDEGDDYELAIARFLDDFRLSGSFDDMVMILTLASRFYKFGHDLPDILIAEVEKVIELYNRHYKKTCKSLGENELEDLDADYQNSIAALQTEPYIPGTYRC